MLDFNFENNENEGADRSSNFPKKPVAGAYVMEFKDAVNFPEKQYVVGYLDWAEGDNKGYANRIEEAYGNANKYLRVYFSYKGGALPFLVQKLKLIAKCNNLDGKTFLEQFQTTDGKNLVGTKIGVVVGEEEYESSYDGVVRTRFSFPELIDIKEIANARVPELKKLAGEDEEDEEEDSDRKRNIPF